ncbi:endo alpha-1,4 polygalactosaminidase [Nocardioides marmoraquaticus]
MRRCPRLLLLLVLLLVGPALPTAAADDVTPFPVGADADYQLGGPRAVPERVGIVVRDRGEDPTPQAEGRFDVCYVNAFQTQPDARASWKRRWDLVLKKGGRPVVDSAWGEWLLDLRTAAKRQRLARIVGGWVEDCADAGYEAVELDNLDSWTRSKRLLTKRQALAYAALLTARAHEAGLAVAQKNAAGVDGTRVGFDFAVAEECGRYRECAAYTDVFGDAVVAVEYRRADFAWTCARFGDRLPVVLRDRDVTPAGVREWC